MLEDKGQCFDLVIFMDMGALMFTGNILPVGMAPLTSREAKCVFTFVCLKWGGRRMSFRAWGQLTMDWITSGYMHGDTQLMSFGPKGPSFAVAPS